MALDDPLPTFALNFWDDALILDPYPLYDRMRAIGPAVWLERHDVWALTHYETIKWALMTPRIFSSASGCMMSDEMNTATRGIMLCTDDPEHAVLRRLFARPLQPKAIASLRPRLVALVEKKIEHLLTLDSFDGVSELAHLLPLTVVTELVGLDEEGRANMLEWASGIFQSFGPLDAPRTMSGIELSQEVITYIVERVDRARMVPGGWGEALFLAADAGTITEHTARMMLFDYLAPSLDTTINATSAALELFAANPQEWDTLRADPALIPHAINEVLRCETPIRAFGRTVTEDVSVGDTRLRAGSKALMLYACGNRDPAKYPDPARFDIMRRPSDHLGFGMGPHVCPGMHLAKLEISIILEVMINRVKRINGSNPVRHAHNTLRGLHSFECRFEA